MIRISIPFFYGLGAAMRQLADIKPGMKLNDVWLAHFSAHNELNNLLSTDWFLPAVRSAFGPGQKLINVLSPLISLGKRLTYETTAI